MRLRKNPLRFRDYGCTLHLVELYHYKRGDTVHQIADWFDEQVEAATEVVEEIRDDVRNMAREVLKPLTSPDGIRKREGSKPSYIQKLWMR